MVELDHRQLTKGTLLARSAVFNLFGQVLPFLVALFTIPLLIKSLGTDRFGLLTLTWMIVGYFAVFDLGLGRALTKLVSEKLGRGDFEDLPSLIWTALALMLLFGMIGSLILGSLSPLLVSRIFKVPDYLKGEALRAFYLLAVSIPIVMSITSFRGILEAKQRFDLTNTIRVPVGIFMFIGPLMVLPFTHKLYWIILVLVAGRIIEWFVLLILCFHEMPSLRNGIVTKLSLVKPLVVFGGWMTISNVISPLLIYLDRFFIGIFLTVTAVAYYSTPWEMVTKLSIIPGAFSAVLFPAFSSSFHIDPHRNIQLYQRGIRYVFLALFPFVLLIITFSKEGLQLWIGPEFAEQSFRVLQLLAIGVLMNGIAAIPFAFIQGAGRPDITAKLHFLEMLLYIPSVWWLINKYQITGAAIAWLLRVSFDAFALIIAAKRLNPNPATYNYKNKIGFIVIAAIITAALLIPVSMKIALFIATMIAFTAFSWFVLVGEEERLFVATKFRALSDRFFNA